MVVHSVLDFLMYSVVWCTWCFTLKCAKLECMFIYLIVVYIGVLYGGVCLSILLRCISVSFMEV